MFKKYLIALATSTIILTTVVQANAAKMRMLVSWSPTYPVVALTEEFATNVEKMSAGKMTISTTGPETVSPFEQLQPVSAGVFDLIFTHPAYHAGTTGIALGLEATDGDPEKRRSSGAWAVIDKHYQKLGLKLISLPVSGKDGFVILLKDPIGADGGLKGRKIRAAPIYHPLIKAFGGSPVVLPAGQIYSALEKGVVVGTAWPLFGPLQFKWHEVAGYLAQPAFGVVTHQIFMNLDKWNQLNDTEKSLLLDEGQKLEVYSYKHFTEKGAAEIAALMANGVKFTEFGPKQKKEINGLWNSGVWGLAEKLNGEEAKQLRQMLIKAGLTK